jgi:hypothetical protein
MRRGGLASLVTLALFTGCELAEVAAPASSDVLIVEAVLRVGATRQRVLLHRSIDSGIIRGEPGANVSVTGPNGTLDFVETDLEYCVVGDSSSWDIGDVEVEASCYLSPEEAGRFVQSGETYELRIETVRGENIRGRTDVPGAMRFAVPAVEVGPGRSVWCELPTNPFELIWTSAPGAWAYVVSLQITNSTWTEQLQQLGVEVPSPLELTGVSVSAADTTLLFPQHLGLFQRGDIDQLIFEGLRGGLPPGSSSVLVILAADRNYTNSIRGGRFNPSGDVRLSSVVGDGVGVFGSVVPLMIRSNPGASPEMSGQCPMG